MPNPDGSMTPAERQQALLATAPAFSPGLAPNQHWNSLASADKHVDEQVAAGQALAGGKQYDPGNQVQSSLFGNLTDAQAQAKQQGDFGLGTNNNAATSAMLGNAQATGDKYSGQFAGDATRAGALSAAAGARGVGMFQGDTSGYQSALGNAANDRGMQQGAYAQLMHFANNGPGPSAAEAQLTQATNANTENALAMARSGRGMGGGASAMRQAIAQNATTQQGASAQAAELRANENTAFQGQRLSAMGAAGNVAGQTVTGDQGTGQLGLAGAQYQTDTALKGTQLNDAASQAWAQQQAAAQQAGMGAEMGAQTQDLNINATALAGRESQWASANQTHGIDTGNATQAGIADANRQQAYVGAGLSAAGGVIAATSDERYKTNVQPLSNQGPAPLPNQAPAQSTEMSGPSKASQDASAHAAEGSAIGGTAGSVAGGVIGSAVGGPVGGVLGGAVGNIAGKALGKLVGSDVRSKDNIQPLSYNGMQRLPALIDSDGEDPLLHYARVHGIAPDWGDDNGAARPRASAPASARDANHSPGQRWQQAQGAGADDSYRALLSLADRHGLSTAADQKDVAKYSQIPAKAFSAAGAALGGGGTASTWGGTRDASPEPEVTRLPPGQDAGFARWLKANNVKDLDDPDSHYDYRGAYLAGVGRGKDTGHFPDTFKEHGHPTFSTESQYSAGSKDGGSWDGETYLPQSATDRAGRVAQVFSRDPSHPILSQGDALLADSARNAPGSMYQYKDPRDGAGTYVGPMAQDLAAHPVTRGAVSAEPGTGKLQVNGARLATVNTAQNHAQQNQIDALGAKIGELTSMLKGSSVRPNVQEGDTGADALATSDERYKRDTVKLSATPRGAAYPDYRPAPSQSRTMPEASYGNSLGRVTFRPTGSDSYPSNPTYQRAAR